MKKLLTLFTVLAFAVSPASVSAMPNNTQLNSPLFSKGNNKAASSLLFGIEQTNPPIELKPPAKPAVQPEPKPEPPKPVEYVVVEGDTLTKIGTAHNVEWQRLWAKNTNIAHPDVIHIGDKLTIPVEGEVLAARELPAAVSLPTVTPGVSTPTAQPVQNSPAAVGNYGGGNTYDYGYCTWYVKNRRGSSIPNNLGNANTWFSRAQAMGMATGYAPRAGAVGTTTAGAYGHVVYVESVNPDGTVNISEMNAPQWGVTTTRTVSAGEFNYIY